jgi:hypothetical protein
MELLAQLLEVRELLIKVLPVVLQHLQPMELLAPVVVVQVQSVSRYRLQQVKLKLV